MTVTPEKVQEVRDWECSMRGHGGFTAIVAFGNLDPVAFVCTNCGKVWNVEAA